jgi:hypothetical protein
VTPFNDHAASEIKQYDQYPGPKPGTIQQVYNIQPLADQSGHTLVMIRNKAADSAALLRFDTHELPCLTLWKNVAAHEDGYVTSIEPGTNYLNNRRIERKHGRVPTPSPSESYSITIDFAIQVGISEVEQLAQEVTRI